MMRAREKQDGQTFVCLELNTIPPTPASGEGRMVGKRPLQQEVQNVAPNLASDRER